MFLAFALACTCVAPASAQSPAPQLLPVVVAPILSTDQVSVWYAKQQGWFAQAPYANPLSLIEAQEHEIAAAFKAQDMFFPGVP